MVGIIESNGMVIPKYCLGLFKRHAVLPNVLLRLWLIPFKSQVTHMHIVHIISSSFNVPAFEPKGKRASSFHLIKLACHPFCII